MKTLGRSLALGAIVLSVGLLAACGDDGGRGGQVSISLTSAGEIADAPAAIAKHGGGDHACRRIEAAAVTLSSILARTLDGVLVDVTIDLPATVDLLALGSGDGTTLPAGFLPAGTYDQFVVVTTQLELTLASGTKVAITPPGGGWTSVVDVSPPFDVVEGQTTALTLEFRKDRSFGCRLGDWEFEPEFQCRRGRGH